MRYGRSLGSITPQIVSRRSVKYIFPVDEAVHQIAPTVEQDVGDELQLFEPRLSNVIALL